jgi:hypothetical protein
MVKLCETHSLPVYSGGLFKDKCSDCLVIFNRAFLGKPAVEKHCYQELVRLAE